MHGNPISDRKIMNRAIESTIQLWTEGSCCLFQLNLMGFSCLCQAHILLQHSYYCLDIPEEGLVLTWILTFGNCPTVSPHCLAWSIEDNENHCPSNFTPLTLALSLLPSLYAQRHTQDLSTPVLLDSNLGYLEDRLIHEARENLCLEMGTRAASWKSTTIVAKHST